MRRLLAWPFSPRSTMSWWDKIALVSWGTHGFLEAVDLGKEGLAGFQFLEQVVFQLFLDGSVRIGVSPEGA